MGSEPTNHAPSAPRAADADAENRKAGSTLLVCVRVPKSGSQSLTRLLHEAFRDRHTFYLPDTLNSDGQISAFQNLRFRRTRVRNLMRRYGRPAIASAFAIIAAEARDGDLIDGGHIDFPTVTKNLARPVKMITLIRDPIGRCISEYNYARKTFSRKSVLSRIDAGLVPKMAARHDFDGFLDFLLDHATIYDNIASRYVGWDGREDLAAFLDANVFHAGTLEQSRRFASGLAEKMGHEVSFPHENRTDFAVAGELTVRQRAKLEKLYARDFELHRWLETRS